MSLILITCIYHKPHEDWIRLFSLLIQWLKGCCSTRYLSPGFEFKPGVPDIMLSLTTRCREISFSWDETPFPVSVALEEIHKVLGHQYKIDRLLACPLDLTSPSTIKRFHFSGHFFMPGPCEWQINETSPERLTRHTRGL